MLASKTLRNIDGLHGRTVLGVLLLKKHNNMNSKHIVISLIEKRLDISYLWELYLYEDIILTGFLSN